MKKLSERQLEVVKMIYEGQKTGTTPTLFELAEKLGVTSKQTVKDLLDAVAKKGYLVRKPRRARAILLKPEAIKEVEEKWKGFKSYIQMTLGLSFSETKNHQWKNSTNLIINYGKSSSLKKIIVDSSSLITDLGNTHVPEYHTKFQLVAEKSNFDRFHDSTSKLFVAIDSLVVTPIMPNLGETGGYVVPENDRTYRIVWSGVNTGHCFRFGKEHGSTNSIVYTESNSNQMKLFPCSMDNSSVYHLISRLRKELRSWSQYADFPIYGSALKSNGEILFWSKRTSGDLNDLAYIFLLDATNTSFHGSDKVLLRDVAYNFPKLVNNSTK